MGEGNKVQVFARFFESRQLGEQQAPRQDSANLHIVEEIALLKTRTSGATRAAAAADPIE